MVYRMKRAIRPDRGMTFVEVLIAATILVLIVGVIARTTLLTEDASRMAVSQGKITILGQKELLKIRGNLRASVHLFQRDTEGNTYWNRLDLGSVSTLSTSVLPKIDTYGVFGKDTPSNRRTGNILFFAKAVKPFPTSEEVAQWKAYCDATGHPEKKSSLDDLRLDVYRFTAYFLRKTGSGFAAGSPRGLDLAAWESVPFADWKRFNEVDPPLQADVLEALRTSQVGRKIVYLWTPGADFDSAFAEIQADFTLQAVTPASKPGWKVPPDPVFTRTSVFERKRISVATNWAQANFGVAKFAAPTTAGEGYPHGLEIQVIGPASARQVLVHLCLVGQGGRGHTPWVDVQDVVSCHDL